MNRIKKQVTNDELARMIAEGFNGVHGSINDVGVKVEAIDNRLRIVETKLDKALYTEINRIEARLKKVEEKVGIR